MTQELIIWVLLAGLVGLSWLMIVAVTTDDRRSREKEKADDTSNIQEDGASLHYRASHRVMAT